MDIDWTDVILVSIIVFFLFWNRDKTEGLGECVCAFTVEDSRSCGAPAPTGDELETALATTKGTPISDQHFIKTVCTTALNQTDCTDQKMYTWEHELQA